MPMKIKYLKRPLPNDREAPAKWYATPIIDKPETVSAMTRAATENTSTAPLEMQAALGLFGNYARKRLLAGESVRLGDLGTLKVTFRSKGVDNIDDVNAGQMIYDVRLRFTPSKEFREGVINNLTFECGGVLDDGVDYSSLAAYRKAKGLSTEEPGSDGSDPDDSGQGTFG